MAEPTNIDPAALRCLGDRSLLEQLQADRFVERALERLRDHEEESPMAIRRQQLASSLRLTPSMAPTVHETLDRCRERLQVEIPMELYVYAHAQFNAACVRPESGRLFVMLSSSLLESFSERELEFVIGHELGHHIFDHHAIPIRFLLKSGEPPSPELTLKLFSWSRYAEISADRAGAHCARDMDAVATALFRLASGLRTDLVKVRIDEFAAQMDDIAQEATTPEGRTPMADWFTTHPFSPLRVKALQRFAHSELAGDGGMSTDELEAHVATLMALMEPSYLDEKSTIAELMRRTLLAGAIAVADADGHISEAEVAVFEKFFGRRSFSDKLDVARIKADLDQRIADMNNKVPPPRRVQVVRDLCLVVRAEGEVEAHGRRVLDDIAKRLEVPAAIVDQTLELEVEPD